MAGQRSRRGAERGSRAFAGGGRVARRRRDDRTRELGPAHPGAGSASARSSSDGQLTDRRHRVEPTEQLERELAVEAHLDVDDHLGHAERVDAQRIEAGVVVQLGRVEAAHLDDRLLDHRRQLHPHPSRSTGSTAGPVGRSESNERRTDGSRGADARAAALDRLVARMVAAGPLRFTVAETDDERDLAYRLRHDAVVSRGLGRAGRAGRRARARRVRPRRGPRPRLGRTDRGVRRSASCSRPARCPPRRRARLVVEPRGQVVDVGRMVVAPSHQDADHTTFVLLLGGLYLEVRRQGLRRRLRDDVGAGPGPVPAARLPAEVLGPDRTYWHEARAPVRFEVGRDAPGLVERWSGRRGAQRGAEHEHRVVAAEAERARQARARTDRPRRRPARRRA